MSDWSYEPTPDFDKTPAQRIGMFPRHPDMLVYAMRLALQVWMRFWLRVYNRFRVFGRENLPLDKPFVMVSNHGSHFDAVCLLAALPLSRIQRAYPAAAKDYFFTTLTKTAFFAVTMNAMPFDRLENPRRSIEMCRELLATPGHVLILFPEGTRTTTGEIAPFKQGIGYLVAGTDVPVVPCFLDGAYRAWPKGGYIPRPRKLTLRIGKPISFADVPNDKEGAKRIAAELETAVRALV